MSSEDADALFGASRYGDPSVDYITSGYDVYFDLSQTAIVAFPVVAKTFSETIQQKFSRLKDAWVSATALCSSFEDIVNDPSYQEIIKIGSPALPLILKDLKSDPKHWFFALWKITGENPIPESASGNLRKMTSAWLKWGRKSGLID